MNGRGVLVLATLVTIVGAPLACAEERSVIDLFDRDGQRLGSAHVNPETGKVDFFDEYSRRLGTGQVDSRGRLETFDKEGKRTPLTLPGAKGKGKR